MEMKINDLVKEFRREAADKEPTVIQTAPACYFYDSLNHKPAAWPDRVFCIGCGGNIHPYEKCEEKDNICERCNTSGHSAKVHNTNQKSLRTQLILGNPAAFDHFLAPLPQKPKGQRGIRVGLSREDRPRRDVPDDDGELQRSDVPAQ